MVREVLPGSWQTKKEEIKVKKLEEGKAERIGKKVLCLVGRGQYPCGASLVCLYSLVN